MSEKIMYFWSDDPNGTYLFDSLYDTVESYIESLSDEEFKKFCNSGKTMKVYLYTEEPINRMSIERLLDFVLEYMDEDYLPEQFDGTEPTERMKDAATDFLNKIEDEYPKVSYSYKKGNVKEVNVLEWVKENRPEWIEGE